MQKKNLAITVYTGPLGPLDLVICKEATPLYWVYGSIRPTTGIGNPKSEGLRKNNREKENSHVS